MEIIIRNTQIPGISPITKEEMQLIAGADGVYVPGIKVLDPYYSPQIQLPTIKGAD
jgi:hypothetical protein